MIGLKKFTAWDDNCVRGISRDLRGHCNHAYFSRTVNPLITPRGAYLFQARLRDGGGGGVFNRDWGVILEGSLFNLEKTMVSVHQKELEYKVEKLKHKKVGGHAAEDQNEVRTSTW